MVPDGWKVIKLGEIAEFRNGLNFLSSDKGFSVKIVGVADFMDCTYVDPESLATVSVSRELRADEYLMDGDIVFVRSNGNKSLIGRSLLVRGINEPISHSGFTIRARITDSQISPEYVALHMRSSSIRRYLNGVGGGTNISNLSQDILSHAPIPIAPPEEQYAIVVVLTTWNRAIEQTMRLIEAKRRLKQGLMQQLLTGKRRLAGITAAPWITVRFGDVFVERVETNRSDLPLLSITADRGVVPRDDVEKRDTSSADKSLYKRIAPSDIGYNTMRMWQGVSALSPMEGIISPAYTVCIPQAGISGPFARHLFKYPPVVHQFFRHSQGLVDDTLNLKFPHFTEVEVRIPCVEEQHRIAEVLDVANREIALLEQRLDVIKKQKQALMQKLLTGQVRVRI